jgi:hypothetical protein
MPVVAMFVNGLELNEQSLYRTFHGCFLPTFELFASDWLISKKSSSLKPLCQMNRNLVGSIYGRSSKKSAHFVPIRIHLAKQFQRRYKEIDQPETKFAYGSHVC